MTALTFGGQRFGTLAATAHTAGLNWNTTPPRSWKAGLTLHGQTTANGDYATHAQLDFSRFNLGTLFRMTHIESFSGESALAGTVTIAGRWRTPNSCRAKRNCGNWR